LLVPTSPPSAPNLIQSRLRNQRNQQSMHRRHWRDCSAAARRDLWKGAIPATAEDAFVLAVLDEKARAEESDELFDILFDKAVGQGRICVDAVDAHPAPADKKTRGRPSVKAEDDERLNRLMNEHPADASAASSAFLRELSHVKPKRAKNRLYEALKRRSDVTS
jgi:hypothetical protein